MDKGLFGPFADKQFWGDIGANGVSTFNSLQNFGSALGQGAYEKSFDPVIDSVKRGARPVIKEVMAPANRASKLSQGVFPEQDWELSQRNALRHSAWVGGMAQAMGAHPDNPIRTPLAQLAAKGLGYGHEMASALDGWIENRPRGAKEKRDTLHDLNNNAIGAEMAGMTRNNEDLYRALSAMAINSRMGAPVSGFSLSDGRLSADAEASPPTKPIRFPTRG